MKPNACGMRTVKLDRLQNEFYLSMVNDAIRNRQFYSNFHSTLNKTKPNFSLTTKSLMTKIYPKLTIQREIMAQYKIKNFFIAIPSENMANFTKL